MSAVRWLRLFTPSLRGCINFEMPSTRWQYQVYIEGLIITDKRQQKVGYPSSRAGLLAMASRQKGSNIQEDADNHYKYVWRSLARFFSHSCQMAIAKFLDCRRLALRAWRTMAPLCCAAKFDPFLSLDCTPRPPPQCNPRIGRDQILQSGNTDCHRANFIRGTICNAPTYPLSPRINKITCSNPQKSEVVNCLHMMIGKAWWILQKVRQHVALFFFL